MDVMNSKWLKVGTAVAMAAVVAVAGITSSDADHHKKEKKEHEVYKSDGPVTLKGEVVDLMCYLDHGAKGPGHAGCAEKCIKPKANGGKGGPVGLLTDDGSVYLVIGEHEPINDKLAPVAAQTVELRGKLVKRGGMAMLANSKIIEK